MKKDLIIGLALLCISTSLFSQSNQKQWLKPLKPDYASFQFAGNIGFLSTGIGYHLFSKKLNTELLYGFVPKHNDTKAIHQITLKNTVPLFRFNHENLVFSPMLGLTTTYETGRHSFVFLDDKYPDGYYRTNAFHFTFLLALNVHKDFKPSYAIQGMDFYYEISSLDTYFWYGISNKELRASEIFSSALGVRLFF
jgi:hypothetical protein